MKKTKERLDSIDPSKITVDYKNKRITITPPEISGYKRFTRLLSSFLDLFTKSFILCFVLLWLSSFYTIEIFNTHLLYDKLRVSYLGQVDYTVVPANPSIAVEVIRITLGASLIYAIIGMLLLNWDKQRNKNIILSQRPKYVFKIRTTNGQKEWRTPIFYNCCLFYNATGDFSKYLQKIKVRELPCRRIQRVDKKTGSVTKSRKSTSPYWWYGTFIFSRVPKSGTLEIRFK